MRTTKFAALFAAVALLVVGATFASFAADPYWAQDGENWTYYDKNGDQVFEDWATSPIGSSNWYYLDESGVMATDEVIEYKDNFYYVDENGLMLKDGWKKIIDDAYDINDDDVNYRWFYFGSDGKAYKNVMKAAPTAAGTKTFIFNKDAEMLYNYVEKHPDTTTDKYEMTADYTEWNVSTDTAYWCGSADDGAVVMNDWISLKWGEDSNGDDENVWLWCQSSGKIAKATASTKTLTIGGVSYTFDACGKLLTGWSTESTATDANYYVDKETGARLTKGFFQAYDQYKDKNDLIDEEDDDLQWYYAKKKNVLAQNELVSVNGKWYGFNAECKMVSGLVTAKVSADKTWVIDKEGNSQDWSAAEFETYCFGTKEYGTDSDVLYYFNENHDGTFGAMKTGTQKVTFDDEEYTLSFKSASNFTNYNGAALNGVVGNYYYQNGNKVTFDSDENKYFLVDCDAFTLNQSSAAKALVNWSADSADTAIAAATIAAKMPNTPAVGTKLDVAAADNYIVFTASGSICKSLSSKSDSDGYKLTVKNYRLTTVENAN